LNESKPIHVVTLEDPVEFVHPQKRSTFNQRELGVDFSSFASGLRSAMRQAPKVILVGEMRDRETMEIVMSAAETGHLVLSTLHTIDAGQTINRVVGMFDREEEKHIRVRLAETVRWIVAQRLLPKVGGGRVAALEIMGTSLRVKESIEHGEAEGKTFYEIMEASSTYGWKTFDMAIMELYEKGQVTEETALLYCTNKGVMSRGLDRIKKLKGETINSGGLKLDIQYGKKI
jgi:twitching motility protein PilT